MKSGILSRTVTWIIWENDSAFMGNKISDLDKGVVGSYIATKSI